MAADTFKLKRGTTAAVNAYLPDVGEPVYNIDTKALTIGDGVTLGGVALTPANANLVALSSLTGAANKGIRFTGPGAMATFDLAPLGVTFLAGTTTQAQRTTLGIPWAGATTSTAASDLDIIADTSILGVTSGTLNMPAGFTSGSMVTTEVFSPGSMIQTIKARTGDLTSTRRMVSSVWQPWAPIAYGGANTNITSITGSAATLTTTRSISATGDGTWTVNFNGSANATGALTLAASGVGAGTYGSVTVNAKGLVTAATTITPVANGGTGLSALATGLTTFWTTPTSANLAAVVTDETGTGALVFATSPTFVTPNLGGAKADSLQRQAPVTKTASFTLGATENWILCNGAGSITVTLPNPGVAAAIGREVMFKNVANQTVISSATNITPQAGGALSNSILAATAGKWCTLVSDGSTWQIMQSN